MRPTARKQTHHATRSTKSSAAFLIFFNLFDIMPLQKDQLPTLYAIAGDAYRQQMTKSAAAKEISRHGGIAQTTANDLVRNLAHMLKGERYRRRLASAVTAYFLEAIHKDFGHVGLANALTAFEQHIDYYEEVAKVNNLTDRIIHKRFQDALDRA